MSVTNTPIRIIVADDHPLFLDSLKGMVNKIQDFTLVGAAANGKELIELARKLKPDIIITDIKMPLIDGIEAIKQIIKELPDAGIIVLSMVEEGNLIVDSLEAGAKGYLLKNAHGDEVIKAVKAVYNNGTYFSKEIDGCIIKMVAKNDYQYYRDSLKHRFSEKELAVMRLICDECSNKQIATKLQITKRAVDGIRDNVLKKVGAKNTAGIVLFAIQNNIYQQE